MCSTARTGGPRHGSASHRTAVASVATAAVAVVAAGARLRDVRHAVPGGAGAHPAYLRAAAPTLPAGDVLLTVPFAFSGSAQPMLWQAVDGMHFRLAGAALKTPDALGRPVGSGAPGSARRILTNLTISGAPLPTGTPAQLATVRHALGAWQVDQVVIAGSSRDPVYASGFFTEALGVGPAYVRGAWVWKLHPGGLPASAGNGDLPVAVPGGGGPADQRGAPLTMSRCVLSAAGRAA